jgi:Flp pilus assembly protein TadG
MLDRRDKRNRKARHGAAAADLALLLTALAPLCLGAVDFARVFHYYVTVTNCARNGALWASDPVARAQSQYTTVHDAAVADAPSDIQSKLTVSPTTPTPDANNNYSVTVQYTFMTICDFPLPFSKASGGLTLSRTVTMRAAPAAAN